jgi:hypothetical protein
MMALCFKMGHDSFHIHHTLWYYIIYIGKVVNFFIAWWHTCIKRYLPLRSAVICFCWFSNTWWASWGICHCTSVRHFFSSWFMCGFESDAHCTHFICEKASRIWLMCFMIQVTDKIVYCEHSSRHLEQVHDVRVKVYLTKMNYGLRSSWIIKWLHMLI